MQSILPDVQASKPTYSIPIKRVGVEGVYRRVCLSDAESRICLDAYIDMFVDLPKDQRGVHVSRFIEALREVLDVVELKDLKNFEEAIEKLGKELLKVHNYIVNAEVRVRTVFLYGYHDKELNLHENVPVRFSMSTKINRYRDTMTRKLCIEVMGMTVCPCAQQVCGYVLKKVTPYTPSHTQRAKLKLCLSSTKLIDVRDLIEASLQSFSIPVFSYLKRDKECEVILKSFENAKFAEDVAREVLYLVYHRLKDVIEPEAIININIKSLESIHPFNMVVYTAFKFGNLKNFLSQ